MHKSNTHHHKSKHHCVPSGDMSAQTRHARMKKMEAHLENPHMNVSNHMTGNVKPSKGHSY